MAQNVSIDVGAGSAAKAGVGLLGGHLTSRLESVLRSLGKEESLERATGVARMLAGDWWDQDDSSGPAWASDITDDHSPFELSLALNGQVETVRLLTEPQDPARPSLCNSWRAAAEIHEEMEQGWHANLSSFDRVADLFAPGVDATERFAIWHSAVMDDVRGPRFKVYVNPRIQGADCVQDVLSEALGRLGLEECWRRVAPRALARGALDEPIYFSLDLDDDEDSRAKIYVAHRRASAAEVARAVDSCPGFDSRGVHRWCQALLGSHGPYLERPPITCYALRRSQPRLHSATLHLPVRCYASDDFDVARTVCPFLSFPQRLRYMRALTAISRRPLDFDRGLQTYVSLRASPGARAVTVYLAPQVYSAVDEPEPLSTDLFGGVRTVERLR